MSLHIHQFFTVSCLLPVSFLFFFFNDTATTEIYTLSLHDALPIYWPRGSSCSLPSAPCSPSARLARARVLRFPAFHRDRKSTRLNSSHGYISYAVFCLKKKKNRRYPLLNPHITLSVQSPRARLTVF